MLNLGIFPDMGNKLKELRKARRWTHEQAAEAMGVSRSQFIKLERSERRLTVDYINQAAKAFNVRPVDIIDEETPDEIPVMGFIGAGAEIQPEFEQVPPEGLYQVTIPFLLQPDLIAFEVRGDSMLPVYKSGHIIVVHKEQKRPLSSFYGEDAVVRTDDGRRFIKTIQRGSNGGVNLFSFNAPLIENVRLEWIGEIAAAIPRSQFSGRAAAVEPISSADRDRERTLVRHARLVESTLGGPEKLDRFVEAIQQSQNTTKKMDT